MAFSYNAGLTRDQDIVRFLLQDTVNSSTRPALLDDGEIKWAIKTEANVYMAAALCADTLASRFRGLVSKKVGGLSLTYESAAKTWESISTKLRRRGSSHQVITAGGVFIADRDALWEDDSLIRPSFFDGMHEDPETLSPARRSDLDEEDT